MQSSLSPTKGSSLVRSRRGNACAVAVQRTKDASTTRKESPLPYQIVSIGRVFNDKTRAALIENMNQYEQDGWQFHSVFGVGEQAGCMGQNTTETLYMVLESKR